MNVLVIPVAGTRKLTGLHGSMTSTIAGTQHSYTFASK